MAILSDMKVYSCRVLGPQNLLIWPTNVRALKLSNLATGTTSEPRTLCSSCPNISIPVEHVPVPALN